MNVQDVLDRIFSIKDRQLPHAFLFAGPRFAGKKKAALDAACRLLDVTEDQLAIHPDFYHLKRSGTEEDESEIKIEEVRALKDRLALTPAFGGWKVAIIERAELLSKEAATALLKTLEEPYGKTVMIMTADRLSGVMPTIRSRAVKILFPPPKMNIWQNLTESEQEEFRSVFKDIRDLPFGLRFKIAEKYSQNNAVWDKFVRCSESEIRSSMLSELGSGTSVTRSVRLAKALIRADAIATHTNANRRMLLDIFLMNF
jgi:hypothetical protein